MLAGALAAAPVADNIKSTAAAAEETRQKHAETQNTAKNKSQRNQKVRREDESSVKEESENGAERQAAIPLTGGLVRSVMVRVQLLFTGFRRRGRHVSAGRSNVEASGKQPASFTVREEAEFAAWFSVEKTTTCRLTHNVAADARGSHRELCSRAPFITNAPRRIEQTRAPPLKVGLTA